MKQILSQFIRLYLMKHKVTKIQLDNVEFILLEWSIGDWYNEREKYEHIKHDS